jgi:hypothetical protein
VDSTGRRQRILQFFRCKPSNYVQVWLHAVLGFGVPGSSSGPSLCVIRCMPQSPMPFRSHSSVGSARTGDSTGAGSGGCDPLRPEGPNDQQSAQQEQSAPTAANPCTATRHPSRRLRAGDLCPRLVASAFVPETRDEANGILEAKAITRDTQMTQPPGTQPLPQPTALSAEEKVRAELNFTPYVIETLVTRGRFRVSADTPEMVELFQDVARRVGDKLQRQVVSYANGREIVITFGQEELSPSATRPTAP